MNLILSGRGVKLDDRLRGYATEKLSKVERFFDHIIKMEIELKRERNPRVKGSHSVEVTVKTPRETIRAHGEGADHFSAIDVAADRLEIQVKRFKARLRGHPHRNGNSEAKRSPGTELVVGEPGADPDESPRIVEMPMRATKPMTPDEATLELEALGLGFLLFTDAETMRAAVVFRRGDGTFGLIAHEG